MKDSSLEAEPDSDSHLSKPISAHLPRMSGMLGLRTHQELDLNLILIESSPV